MNKLDLDEIRKRCEAATPGPWNIASRFSVNTIVYSVPKGKGWLGNKLIDVPEYGCVATPHDRGNERQITTMGEAFGITDDAKFIAHARTDIPALLDALEKAQAVIEASRVLHGLVFPMPADECRAHAELGFALDAYDKTAER